MSVLIKDKEFTDFLNLTSKCRRLVITIISLDLEREDTMRFLEK